MATQEIVGKPDDEKVPFSVWVVNTLKRVKPSWKDAADSTEMAVRIGMNVFPYGGVIEKTLFGSIDYLKQERIFDALEQLADILENQKIQEDTIGIINEFFSSMEGMEFFAEGMQAFTKMRTEERRRYLAQLMLSHAGRTNRVDIEDIGRHMDALLQLPIEAFVVLQELEIGQFELNGGVINGGTYGETDEPKWEHEKPGVSESIAIKTQMEREEVEYCLQQLQGHGLIKSDGLEYMTSAIITRRGEALLAYLKETEDQERSN